MAKYSFLELMFADRWQWVRRRSKGYWVRDQEIGTMWVKFNNDELELIKSFGVEMKSANRLVEDWRPSGG